LKKFRRYSAGAGGSGSRSDYSSNSRASYHSSNGGGRSESFNRHGGAGEADASYDRYEEVKHDYYQSMRARDERPALVPDFKNFFADGPQKKDASPKARSPVGAGWGSTNGTGQDVKQTTPQGSALNSKKWGRK
jgi:hypothetical protein